MTHDAAPEAASFDVVVVGARCAGAATALQVARAGRNVLLVDRGEYGADTLSTHALMRGGVLQLHRWGLLPRIVAAGTPPISRTTFHRGSETLTVPIKSKFGVDVLYAPRRTVLDKVLVDAAREAGATVWHGVRVTGLSHRNDGSVDGVDVVDRAGLHYHLAASFVVGADGMRSTVAHLVGAPTYQTARFATATLYGYWPGLANDGYQWYYGRRTAAGAVPTNEGDTLVFATVPAAVWPDVIAGDRSAAFLRVLQQAAPELARWIEAAGPRPLTGYAGQVGYFRQSWGQGWALVGDAGYFKDPLTAHGITDALRDAELLADALIDGSAASLATYQQTRDALSQGLFETTDRIASFEWSFATLGGLLERLAEEMAQEVKSMAQKPLALG